MSTFMYSRFLQNYIVPKRLFGRSTDHNGNLETYYDILRVPENSNREQIREAFMQLSKQFHPDVGGRSGNCEIDRTAMFVKIAEAYQTLSRPSLKKQYDQTLWLRTVAQRNIKSGSYGFIHDFHCFGRKKPVYPFEINANTMTKLRPTNQNVQRQSLPETTPRVIFQITNMVASYMSYSGVCGAVFSVVNARCGIDHVKLHRALKFHGSLGKRRINALEILVNTGRKYFITMSAFRKRRENTTMTTNAPPTTTAAPRGH